jgi:hypothetical protein
VHRSRNSINEAAWIDVEREAPGRSDTGRTARSGNDAIGGEARRIVDSISRAVH